MPHTDVRNQIIREAANLFILFGVKKVKMDIIAASLKISKRTIYENFRNKDSLIRATIDFSQEEQNKKHAMILDGSDNIIEAVLKLLNDGIEILSKINPRYYSDMQRLYPRIWKDKIEKNKLHSRKFILGLIREGKAQGLYRNDFNDEVIAHILTEQLSMLSEQDSITGKGFSPAEIYRNLIISMTRGIASERGLELMEKYTIE